MEPKRCTPNPEGLAGMSDVTFVSRPPSPSLKGLIVRLSGYATTSQPSHFLETAELVVPLIFNLGRAWNIGLGDKEDERTSNGFTSGLFPGPVRVSCPRHAELVQVDLTPLGAARFFGGEAKDLTGQVIDMASTRPFGERAESLHDQLFCTPGWDTRFNLVERFLAPRFVHAARAPVWAAWAHLAAGLSVAETARRIGWSTRHLSTRFRNETGVRPITAARMMRFRRARILATSKDATGWTDVAAAAGYADQSHLIRDFREFAGSTPASWARQSHPAEARPLA